MNSEPTDRQLMNNIAEHFGVKSASVCLGAGSISQWAHALPEQLAALGEGG